MENGFDVGTCVQWLEFGLRIKARQSPVRKKEPTAGFFYFTVVLASQKVLSLSFSLFLFHSLSFSHSFFFSPSHSRVFGENSL